MAIYQRVVNFDTMFHQLAQEPVILNDLANYTEEDRKKIMDLVSQRYSSDMVSLLPSCQCGSTKGEFSKETRCTSCGTIVKAQVDDEIEPNVWIRRPNGVEPLMNPTILMITRDQFKKQNFDVIHWLIDRTYRSNTKEPKVVEILKSIGVRRGYNHFVNHFEEIIELLYSTKQYGKPDDVQVVYYKKLIQEYKDCLFSDYLPIVHKVFNIIEDTNIARYIDANVFEMIDTVMTMVSIDKDFYDQNSPDFENDSTQHMSGSVKENRTAKGLIKLSNYYLNYIKNDLSQKSGQFRRHVYGSRNDLTIRAVITSITEPHQHNELHIPWGAAIVFFRPDLINKLMTKSGMDHNSAVGLLMGHVTSYHPLIDQYFNEIIKEASGGEGVIVLLNRFPALLQGSIIRERVTKVKTDPNDQTIGLGILVVRSLNAEKF